MNRPLHGPLNPTPVDHSTDTYDTIDWLVKNVPETNGKVGILGISYDGFLPLMALVNPHPALKVSVPMNPMVDGWMGDDWFHNGAFRQQNMPYIYEQEATRDNDAQVVDRQLRRLRHVHARPDRPANSGGATAWSRWASGARFWRIPATTPSGATRPWTGCWPPQPLKVPVMLVAQPLGPGGHLRRAGRLQGHQAEGHGQRQGVPGARPLASRAGDRRRQHAGRAAIRQRHRALFPPRTSCGRSSIII